MLHVEVSEASPQQTEGLVRIITNSPIPSTEDHSDTGAFYNSQTIHLEGNHFVSNVWKPMESFYFDYLFWSIKIWQIPWPYIDVAKTWSGHRYSVPLSALAIMPFLIHQCQSALYICSKRNKVFTKLAIVLLPIHLPWLSTLVAQRVS